jgi:hypothetical protein
MSNTITLPLNVVYQLSAETERLHASLELCFDSLRLHSVLGLDHVEFMLRELADKSYETLETLNNLQKLGVQA